MPNSNNSPRNKRLMPPEVAINTSFNATKSWCWKLVTGFDRDSSDSKAPKTDQTYLRNTFYCFGELPTELRLRIWEYASPPQPSPRIQCLKELHGSRSDFISSQPIPPLLHTCQESRGIYHDLKKGIFAFNSYINFDIDVIYVIYPDPWFYQRLLCVANARLVQNIAVRCADGILYETNSINPNQPWKMYTKMRDHLPNWKTTFVVSRDPRLRDEVWKDVDMKFVTPTSFRGRGFVRNARKWADYFNSLANLDGFEAYSPLDYTFVAVDSGKD